VKIHILHNGLPPGKKLGFVLAVVAFRFLYFDGWSIGDKEVLFEREAGRGSFLRSLDLQALP
jgi:hypothetical protein